MLTTEWSQDGGENALLPMIGTSQAVTGCGVTATAQVMKYWAYPEYGKSANYYIWDNPAGGSEVRYADFAATRYDWDNMVNQYKNNSALTSTEIEAVAILMRDLGVALQVKYQDESTATNLEYISSVLKRYFGYNSTMTIHRYKNGAYTMDEWLTLIYSELSAGRPIIMGGSYLGANHIYVADGYDASGKVHLNLGKANVGSSININGYFDLTRTDETYTSEMRMLIGIAPYELKAETPEFTVEKAGTLKEVLGGELISQRLCRVKLRGNLNVEDFRWLKKLSAITTGQLSYIDMSEAMVEDNNIPNNAFEDSYTLQEIILPNTVTVISSKAFRNANGLWKVSLPDGLEEIGDYVFSGCRYLDSLTLPTTLSGIGYNPMRYVHLSTFNISEGNKMFTLSNGALCDKNNTLYSMPMLFTEEYKIEEGVRQIFTNAFSLQCMIPAVYLPHTVERVRNWAFYNCISLKDFYVLALEPPVLGEDCFSGTTLRECVLHVPEGTLKDYLNSDWKVFANIVDDIVDDKAAEIARQEAYINLNAQVERLRDSLAEALNTIAEMAADVKDEFTGDAITEAIDRLQESLNEAYNNKTIVEELESLLSVVSGIEAEISKLVVDALDAQAALDADKAAQEASDRALADGNAQVERLRDSLAEALNTIAEMAADV
ncbi:MAG: C10 family peptidase, partial [Muribaculaceae bacterium]|nr:C10 family peptidase [Muribaculaceae bacterium]